MPDTGEDRALGAMIGLALGDAMGMPTQSMSRDEIRAAYGPITGLRDAVPSQPIAPSMRAGTITDDTEQAMLVARLLISGGGHIEPLAFAHALIEWERAMEAKGSLDLLGPSTKAAVAAIEAGAGVDDDPGAGGSTNGAAMRITPVGIAFPIDHDPSMAPGPTTNHDLAAAVIEASRLTHNTGIGLGAAGAVAAAASHALDHPCATMADHVMVARQVCAHLEKQGNWVAGGSVSARILHATRLVADMPDDQVLSTLDEIIGTSVAAQEAVPAAFALASRFADDPYHAICLAAEVGGDTDTIAAMAGAILGAHHGMSAWPMPVVDQVISVNGLDVESVVHGLLSLRYSAEERNSVHARSSNLHRASAH